MILGVAAVGVFMSAPGQSFSVAAFIDPMLKELVMPRSQYSTAYLVATLLGGLLLPYIGRLLDRLGARIMLPTVGLLLGLACLWMSQVEGLLALYVGFSLIRSLGQGSLTLISTWMVGEWFEKRRGLAMGLVGLGGTFSVMTVPQIDDLLIHAYGWRHSWMLLALGIWIALILPGILFVRDRPEDLGLLPDGERPSPDAHDDEESESASVEVVQPTHESWTVAEACRTSAFWKLIAVVSTTSLVGTGIVFHQVSLLGELGVSRTNALRLFSIQALVGTLSSIGAGYLTDRWPARYLLAIAMFFLSLALVMLLILPSPGWLLVYACFLGLQGGIIRSTGTAVWINYYGRLHQGAVRGVAMSAMVIAAAFGPLPLAIAMDLTGDYRNALFGFLLLPALSGLCVLTAVQPVKRV